MSTSTSTPRDPSVDALRGFALLGVVVVNAPFFAIPVDGWLPLAGLADRIASFLTVWLGAGKFFLIFSFLYGYGIGVALERAAASGGGHGPLVRRCLALFAFGVAHATLFFLGDILMLYALLGFALLALRGAATRTLTTLALVSFALAIVAQAGIVSLAMVDAAARAAPEVVPGVGYLGDFAETVRARLAELPQAIVFILAFNGPAAFAMALAGRLAARAGAFPPSETALASWARHRWWALGVGGLLSAVAAGIIVPASATAGTYEAPIVATAVGLLALASPVLSFGLATSVVLHARHRPRAVLVRAFAVVGRSSLSGYLLHSVLLGAVFFGWGLGLWGSLDAAAIFGIALATYTAIVVILVLWRRVFSLGPDEYLMRFLVYGGTRKRA